jgi:hypothetical protein
MNVCHMKEKSEREERTNHKGIRIISREEICRYTQWNHEFQTNKQFSIQCFKILSVNKQTKLTEIPCNNVLNE